MIDIMVRRVKERIVLKYDSTVNFFADSFTRMSTHEGFKRYFKNTGWMFAGKLSAMGASFFVGAYVARYLGPEQYGLLNYAAGFAGLFAVFASFGIDSILSRELIAFPEKRDKLLGSGFAIKLAGAALAITLICVSLFFIEADRLTNVLVLLSAATFILSAFGVIDIYFQARVLAKRTVWVQMTSLIINAIIKIVLVYREAGLVWFAGVYLIDGLILVTGFVFSYRRANLQILKWQFDRLIALRLIKNSWPLMLSSAAVMVYMKIDQVMIKHMIGNEATGLYSVAVKLSEVWYFIPTAICASVFPAIINAKKVGQALYERRLRRLYALLFYLAIFIAIPITLLAGAVIVRLFGASYFGAIGVLRIHIWAGVGVFLGAAVSQYLVSENYSKIFLYTTVIGAILNVVLNLFLIPRYGISGAAIATLISYIAQTFSVVFFKKTRKQILLIYKGLLFNYE